MDMADYLKEIQHAATSVISIVWADHREFEKVQQKLDTLKRKTQHGYQQAQNLANDEDEDPALATGAYWDTYFGPDKRRFHADKQRDKLENLLQLRDFSRNALASSILQFAKQGISIVHGELKNAPAGRIIHGINLKEIIWQGRNQALHWEEGKLRKPVVDCFEKLKNSDSSFADYNKRCLAFAVVQTLGWTEWNAFKKDMLSLR